MGFFLTYSLICSVILILVWSVYKCTLSRLNCFRFNRVALSCGYVISFVLPAIILHLNDGSPATNATVSMLFETVGCDDPGHLIMFETPQASMTDYIAVGYVIGCSCMAAYLLCAICRILLFICRGKKQKVGEHNVIIHTTENVAPFSFGEYIVLSDTDFNRNAEIIMLHEAAHVDNKHWIDLILAQFALIVSWYNPVSWFLLGELHSLHEYEADNHVLKSGINRMDYQMFLIREGAGSRFDTISDSINNGSLKERINMMFISHKTGNKRLFSLVFIPIICGVIYGFNSPSISSFFHSFEEIEPSLVFNTADSERKSIIPSFKIKRTINDDGELVKVIPDYDPTGNSLVTEADLKLEIGKERIVNMAISRLIIPQGDSFTDMDVIVQFKLTKDGHIEDLKVLDSSDKSLDDKILETLSQLYGFTPRTLENDKDRTSISFVRQEAK